MTTASAAISLPAKRVTRSLVLASLAGTSGAFAAASGLAVESVIVFSLVAFVVGAAQQALP